MVSVRHMRAWRRERWRSDCGCPSAIGTAMKMNNSRLLTVWAFSLLCLCGVLRPASALTADLDLAAMQKLKLAWQGSQGDPLSDWSGNDPCGSSWKGVVCNVNQVTQLTLSSLNLTGGIPPAIGGLTDLNYLDLSYNEFLGGPIPKEFGLLTSLANLMIKNCGLTGPIPDEIGNMTSLSYLALNQNGLSGPIPASIGNLKNLSWFDISENQIEGPLPVSTDPAGNGLDKLVSAQHFHFNNNSMTGAIPPEIFNLPKILHVLLDGNSLGGTIPRTVGNSQTLAILRLDSNNLAGNVPRELGQATVLNELNLANNSFTGPIPDLANLTNLLLLDLSNNPFSPQLMPAWMASDVTLSNLTSLTANSAGLNGPLDPNIFALSAIQSVSLNNNALNGSLTFPTNIARTLTVIDVENNNFEGFNPTSGAINVSLAGNPFCSQLLQGSTVCQSAKAETSWTYSYQACKFTCQDGRVLNPNVCRCAYPLTCDMRLTSPPFSTVDGDVVSSLIDEFSTYFQLDRKQVFIGYANFSNSRLYFNLLFFPSSGDGPLPSTDVDNITMFLSSTKLHLKEGPFLLLNVQRPPAVPASSSSISKAVIIGIVVGALLIALIVALVVAYAIRQKRRADRAEVSRPFASWGGIRGGDPGDAPQLKGARWFSLAELKKATNNFSENNEVGSGGYGKVYKAVLANSEVVAVKRAEEGSMQGAAEFKMELELLSRVHHRNLVGLVGFCYESGEQMLIYEFMENGTLRDHLLGRTNGSLKWETRIAIALGSARGIAYLHDLANPPIIHRDIKSSNILLDGKMVAKVADFGLSKLAPDGQQKNHVSTQVKGTLGYLDPEYYMTNQLSEKSDVYSFGVVLLEMLSARQPIERGRYIVREVRTALDKGGITALKPLLDPFLGDYPQKQLEAILDLALRCVEEAASGRPTMNEVVKELEVLNGSSQPNSGVHITIEPPGPDDLYSGKGFVQKTSDPSFQYSGGFVVPTTVEPK